MVRDGGGRRHVDPGGGGRDARNGGDLGSLVVRAEHIAEAVEQEPVGVVCEEDLQRFRVHLVPLTGVPAPVPELRPELRDLNAGADRDGGVHVQEGLFERERGLVGGGRHVGGHPVNVLVDDRASELLLDREVVRVGFCELRQCTKMRKAQGPATRVLHADLGAQLRKGQAASIRKARKHGLQCILGRGTGGSSLLLLSLQRVLSFALARAFCCLHSLPLAQPHALSFSLACTLAGRWNVTWCDIRWCDIRHRWQAH
mmetsp:Transcript_86236/g.143467  ORF Transcript_86236/g.143467 Transcript_86236/m.143467 type:complete len:257 (-) Transcript_86236:70-840(-)